MATKREEAQKRRAEERRKRRASSQPEPDETSAEEPEPEALDTVKHAAKVAAAAAAVGAAMGAARAMTGSGHDGDEPGHTPEPEPAPEPEQPERPEQPEQPEPQAKQEEPREEPEPQAKQEEPREEPRREPEEDPRPSGAGPGETRRLVESAREQLGALLGKEPDSVSGLDRSGDHWIVTLEVVELPRIPESTDVLASYEVELDGDGNLVRYARRRRYYRSQADDGESS